MRKLLGIAVVLALAVAVQADPRASDRGFTVFVRDSGIGTTAAIAAWDTFGFTQMSTDAVIRAMFAPDSKFDSLQSGNIGKIDSARAVWSGTATADSSVRNNFFQGQTGAGTVTSVTGLFGNASSARSAGFLIRRADADFLLSNNWTVAGIGGRFASGNPSDNEILFYMYTSPDIAQIGFDTAGRIFGRISDDGRATWDSVSVNADKADSAYHFITLQVLNLATDSLRITVDDSTKAIALSSFTATTATMDTAVLFSFRSGVAGSADCRCRSDALYVIEDTVTVDRHMRRYIDRALREARGVATDSFKVHIAGIGTDSAAVDTQMTVGVRTPVATSRTWHAFETAWVDSDETLPILVYATATSPRQARLDSIPGGRTSFDIAQLLIGDNQRGVPVLEEVEFHHEGLIDTTLWELRVYESIEDTRDLNAGYDAYTARLHPNQNRALLRVNRVLSPASFATVYVQGTAATTGSVTLRGRRR